MSEGKPTSTSVSMQRVKLASSSEWKNLLTHFELTGGEGFAFIVLLVADAEWAEACRLSLERYLLSTKKTLQVVSFQNPDEFSNELATTLLNLEIAPDTGAVWMAAVVSEAEKDYKRWVGAWRSGVARLNQYRNPLIRHFDVPLIFAGAPWIQPILREMSPDLWSVRSMVVRIESLVSKAMSVGNTSASIATASSETIDVEGQAIDPEFALHEAAQLRGRIGSERALARLLYRAGVGFNARSRWAEGAEALSEAVELYRRLPDSKEELASALFNLSSRDFWQKDYAQATANLTEAQTLFREVGNVLDEANSIESLGDIALEHSDHAVAAELYERALLLHRQVGNVLGEANCIKSLGEIAVRRSDHIAAAELYERALSLYRKIGNVLGEANCIQSLGDIALERSDHTVAAEFYQRALSLYREIGNVLGEANCIESLGDIAVRRSDHIAAAELYERALSLYREVGDVLGEANCIKSLGDIALERSDHAVAAELYERALSLYREVDSLQGEANCIKSLGDIALATGRTEEAASLWRTALDLYESMADPYSIGIMHRCLARIAASDLERKQHIEAARAAWQSVDRLDLITEMEKQFAMQHGDRVHL
jgi:tetratricopeptide (TPR) repeat protein